MSNIYHTEPPTEGKVLIHTTAGDIDIELWSKEAPLACRNFIQLSLEGYYDNTIINRIIKDFMIQAGDPTGTGTGGSSIWNKPFKDEIHGRIKFNHRGQVAMANENRPNTNQSQFFITLGPCEWLNRKHTIFGKITGNTIFNVLKLGEVEVGPNDKPIETIKIKSVEVLWNPFDNIIPRTNVTRTISNDNNQKKDKKKDRKAAKDLKLLSFGDDEIESTSLIETNDDLSVRKMISAHDANINSQKLSSEVDEELLQKIQSEQSEKRNSINTTSSLSASSSRNIQEDNNNNDDNNNEDGENDFEMKMLNKIREKRKKVENKNLVAATSKISTDNWKDDQNDEIYDNEDDNVDDLATQKGKEYAQLKKEMLRSRKAIKVLTGQDAENHRNDTAFQELMTPLEQRRQRYVKRKKEFGNREEETLSKLAQFSNNLKKAKSESSTNDNQTTTIYSETYTGQVLEKDDDEMIDTKGWHLGKLKFRKHIDDLYRMGGDGRSLDDYKVEDSRITNR